MNSLIWGNPQAFWGLALVPVLWAFFVFAERQRGVLLARLVAARLQTALAGNASVRRRQVHFALLLGALIWFVLALARPQYGFTYEEAKRKGRDVLLAVDTSRSMLATDVAPSRLERTKLAVQDLLNTLEGDRVGLVAFAGSSFLQAPLTVDYQAVESTLGDLDTNVIPLGGTNIAEAIRAAAEAFGKGESESRCLILFTDGDELEQDAVEAARKVAGSIRIFTVGVGSANGSLISVPGPNGGTEFVRDESGNYVKSRLDEERLKQIAEVTGGFYIHLQNGPADMRRLVQEGLAPLKEAEIDERLARRPIERYQWPLGVGLLLLVCSLFLNERRRATKTGTGGTNGISAGTTAVKAALVLLMAGMISFPNVARAEKASVEELFKTGDFKAAKTAAEDALKKQPTSPVLRFNKGAAEYALGNYDAAVDEFSSALASSDPELRAKAEYNLGTALLQRSLKRDIAKEYEVRKADLRNAIQHFDEALKLNPNHTDAKENQTVAKEELERPKPTPPPKQNQKNKDKKKQDEQKDQKEQKEQQNQDQQGQGQENKDDQNQDQQGQDQQSKDGKPKDEQGGDQSSEDENPQNQPGKDGKDKEDAPDSNSEKSESGKEQPEEKSSDGSPQPTPAPTEEKKLSGDIKAADSGKESEKPNESGEEAAALEAGGTNGEMSPNQAKMLLDSLKSEDVQPFKPQQKGQGRVLKDW